MADNMEVAVLGADKAVGETKKIAGGYRAIGHAADQAAHSADKVHGAHGGAARARTFSRAFLGGRGGAGGALGHMGHLGLGGGAAYVAMEVMTKMAESGEKKMELVIEDMKFQRTLATEIAEIENRRNTEALSAARSMSIYEQGRADATDQGLSKTIKQTHEFDKMKKSEELATRGDDASSALSKEKIAYRNPALMQAMADLKPDRDALVGLKYKADNQDGIGKFMASFKAIVTLNDPRHATDASIYNDKLKEYNSTSSEAIDVAREADIRRQEQISEAMKNSAEAQRDSANMFRDNISRSQSGLPVP